LIEPAIESEDKKKWGPEKIKSGNLNDKVKIKGAAQKFVVGRKVRCRDLG